MSLSNIEWTDVTWNPLTGCNKVSPGCKYCYAERMSRRLHSMGMESYRNGFQLTLHDRLLNKPLSWKKPRMVFVNSMSDLFHPKTPESFIQQVFSTMREAKQHIFQVLTKRSERLLELNQKISWPSNVWMGVSVENEDYQFRIDQLRETSAKIKFLSLEPLLGPLPKLNLEHIHWVIVGGESGPHARPIKEAWVRSIQAQCQKSKIAFFFKQWGGKNKKKSGRILMKKTWNEMPDVT